MSYTEREELLIALQEFMVSGSASGVEYEAAEALASLLCRVPLGQEPSESEPQRRVCSDHGTPDCSPLLNGCSRLTGQEAEHG